MVIIILCPTRPEQASWVGDNWSTRGGSYKSIKA